MRISKRAILIALAVLVALFFSGFRVAHPKDGLSNALGSANSVLGIYRTSSNFEVGTKVIVNLDASSKSPVLAVIRAKTPTTMDIQAGPKLVRVKTAQVYGKLLAVVPFLGSVLGVIGL